MAEQDLAGRRKVKPLALANEKPDREVLFELTDPGRDIGLHAMQPLRRPRHASFAHHRAEDLQIRQIHSSLHEIINITIIHFM